MALGTKYYMPQVALGTWRDQLASPTVSFDSALANLQHFHDNYAFPDRWPYTYEYRIIEYKLVDHGKLKFVRNIPVNVEES